MLCVKSGENGESGTVYSYVIFVKHLVISISAVIQIS